MDPQRKLFWNLHFQVEIFNLIPLRRGMCSFSYLVKKLRRSLPLNIHGALKWGNFHIKAVEFNLERYHLRRKAEYEGKSGLKGTIFPLSFHILLFVCAGGVRSCTLSFWHENSTNLENHNFFRGWWWSPQFSHKAREGDIRLTIAYTLYPLLMI